MKKLILSLIISLSFFLTISGQVTFQLSYDAASFDIVAGVKPTTSGYIAAFQGITNGFPPDLSSYLMDIDTIGNINWAKKYSGSAFDESMVADLQKISGNNYLMTGTIDSRAWVLKTNSSGTVSFSMRCGAGTESGNTIKEMSSSDLIVAGTSSAKGMNPNKDSTSIYIFKTNSSGAYQWGRSYTLTSPTFDSHDAAYDVVGVSDGYVFTGYHSENNGADTTTNILLFKTDFNGTLQWMKSYGGLGDNEAGYAILYLSSTNEFVILGNEGSGGIALIKTDASGTINYSTTYYTGLAGITSSIVKTPDGGYAIFGWSTIFPNQKFFLLKLNSAFGIQFTKQYSSPTITGGIIEGDNANDGGYILGALSGGQTSWDLHLIKTDANGTSGCNENNFTAVQSSYSPATANLTPIVHTGGSGSAYNVSTTNVTPAKSIVCLDFNCTEPNSSISPSSAIICSGNSTTLSASGGGTYLWSTGSTNSSISVSTAGTYTVTVTVSGCDSVPPPATVTVNSNPVPTITPNGPTNFCQSGNVILTSSTASSYSWSNSLTTPAITVSSAGNYTVTVTYANGCTNSSAPTAITINNNPTPTISPSGPTTFCQGGSVTLTASAANSFLWSDGTSASSLNATSSGTYSVTVTDGNGCSGSASTTVSVNPNPSPLINGASSVCSNSNGTYSVTNNPGNSYTWTIVNGTINSGQGTNSVSVTWNASGAASLSVTETVNATTCSGTNSVNVTINSSLNPAITVNGSSSICQQDTVILSADAGYSSYLWSTGENNDSIAVTTAGTYTVSVTDANGCSGSSNTPVTITVNTNPNPVINITGSSTICEGDSVMLDAGNSYTTYLWSTGDVSTAIYADSTGSYSVTVTDANGCTGSSSTAATVNVIQVPVVNLTTDGSTTFCSGDSVTLNAGPGYSNYLWNTGEISQSIVVIASGTYSVSVTDSNGCSNDSSATSTIVTVNSLPLATISGNAPACSGDTVFLISSGGVSYQWNDGSIDSVLAVVASGTFTVIVMDTNDCEDIDSAIVTIYPSYTIPVNANICQGESIFLQGNYQSLAGTYWDSLITINGCDSVFATTLTINPTVTSFDTTAICIGDSLFLQGDYQTTFGTYFDTVSAINTCDSVIATVLLVNPVANSNSALTICNGDSIFLQNNFQKIAGTYYDTLSTFNGCDSVIETMLTINPTFTSNDSAFICSGDSIFLQGAYQTVQQNYFDTLNSINGCDSVIVTALTINQLPTLSISALSSSICAGELTNLCVTTSGQSLLWSNGLSTNCITVSPMNDSIFSVSVSDLNSCSNSDSALITVTSVPEPSIEGDSITCSNRPVNLIASGGAEYLWNTGDSGSVAIVNPNSDSTFYVTVSNGNCSASDSLTITVLQAPQAANAGVSPDTIIHFGDNAPIAAYGNGTFSWSPSDHLSCTSCANPVANPDSTTVYYLTVTASNGCLLSDSVIVTVDYPPGDVFVPNIFSPNGDGHNDVLLVYGRYVDKIDITIYDRWGEKIYYCEGLKEACGWDGIYEGNLLNTAVFAYYLKAYLFDGTVFEKQGNFTLSR